jgi:hypothetical protein
MGKTRHLKNNQNWEEIKLSDGCLYIGFMVFILNTQAQVSSGMCQGSGLKESRASPGLREVLTFLQQSILFKGLQPPPGLLSPSPLTLPPNPIPPPSAWHLRPSQVHLGLSLHPEVPRLWLAAQPIWMSCVHSGWVPPSAAWPALVPLDLQNPAPALTSHLTCRLSHLPRPSGPWSGSLNKLKASAAGITHMAGPSDPLSRATACPLLWGSGPLVPPQCACDAPGGTRSHGVARKLVSTCTLDHVP